MKQPLLILCLLAVALAACGQDHPHAENTEVSTVIKAPNPLEEDPDHFIYSSSTYTDAAGNRVLIQNGFPRGGGSIDDSGKNGYTDPSGEGYGVGIFWHRMVNESDMPVEIKLDFGPENRGFEPQPETWYKLYVLPFPMTTDKLDLYNYGMTGLKFFLDLHYTQPTSLRKTIAPREEIMFCMFMLLHVPNGNGPIRTEFVSEGQALTYRVVFNPYGSSLIPCGELIFKEK